MVSRLKISSKSNYKNSNFNDNITIDAKHNEMISLFQSQKESIPELKEELKKLTSEYNNNRDNSRKNDIDYIIYRDNLREKINNLKDKINSIINDDDLNKYYLEVGTLLHTYYENVENSKNSAHNSENFEENLINYNESDDDVISNDEYLEDDEIEKEEEEEKKNKKSNVKELKKENYKSVLTFFNTREQIKNNGDEIENELEEKKNNEELDELKKESVNTKSNGYTSMKISDFVKEEARFKKKDILEEYLQKIDSKYISRIKVDSSMYKCPNCNLEMTLYPSDGYQICENCGIQQNIFIESDKPSFKDPPIEVCYFSYKRINHYNESMPLSTILLIL
jgi:hypothetical protein